MLQTGSKARQSSMLCEGKITNWLTYLSILELKVKGEKKGKTSSGIR